MSQSNRPMFVRRAFHLSVVAADPPLTSGTCGGSWLEGRGWLVTIPVGLPALLQRRGFAVRGAVDGVLSRPLTDRPADRTIAMKKLSGSNERVQKLVEVQKGFAQVADGLEADLKKLPHVARHGPSAARYERGQVVADAKYRAGGLLLRAFKLGAFADAQKAPSVIAVLDPPGPISLNSFLPTRPALPSAFFSPGSGPISLNSMLPALVDAMRGFLVETGHQFLPITTLPEDGWNCVLTIRTLANLVGDTVKGVSAKAGGQGNTPDDLENRVTSLERQTKKPPKPPTQREKIRKQRNDFSCKRRRKPSAMPWSEIYAAYIKKFPNDKKASDATLRLSHDRNCEKCFGDKS